MQVGGESSNLMIALEQRNINMGKILNITKQLTVKADQEEIDFQNLLDTRVESMDKIDKCNLMIKNEMNTLPKETYDVLESILGQTWNGTKFPQEFEPIQTLVTDYYDMLSRAKEFDIEAVEKVRESHAGVKAKILKTQKSK